MKSDPRARKLKRILAATPERTVGALGAAYQASWDKREALYARRRRAEAAFRRADEAYTRAMDAQPSWIDICIRPIAAEMARILDADVEALGPFGLAAEIAIYVYPKGTPERDRSKAPCRVLAIRPLADLPGLGLVDYATDTGDFAPNTLGARNGLNHPVVPIPPEADARWFIERLRPV